MCLGLGQTAVWSYILTTNQHSLLSSLTDTAPYCIPTSRISLAPSNSLTNTSKMTTAFPPGGTYFDGRKSFADVNYDASKDNAINTTQFLEAAESLTTLFDVLGSAAFKPVKSDMQGNIKVSSYVLY
jgi:hypothetical protein